jgi:hypothetical protein
MLDIIKVRAKTKDERLEIMNSEFRIMNWSVSRIHGITETTNHY